MKYASMMLELGILTSATMILVVVAYFLLASTVIVGCIIGMMPNKTRCYCSHSKNVDIFVNHFVKVT